MTTPVVRFTSEGDLKAIWQTSDGQITRTYDPAEMDLFEADLELYGGTQSMTLTIERVRKLYARELEPGVIKYPYTELDFRTDFPYGELPEKSSVGVFAVTRTKRPSFDHLTEALVDGLLGNAQSWTIVRRPDAEQRLATARAAKNQEINAARLAANNTYFTHRGMQFACDTLSKDDIVGTNGEITSRGGLPTHGWVGAWKAIDNSYLSITTLEEWQDFYSAMFSQGTANFLHAQQLKNLVANAETQAQLDAINWETVI